MALDRTRLAHERTLMAWVRTSISLISFGFTIDKFFAGLRAAGTYSRAHSYLGPHVFGLLMITTGLVALTVASLQHYRDLVRMRSCWGTVPPSTALIVAGFIAILGIFSLCAVLIRA